MKHKAGFLRRLCNLHPVEALKKSKEAGKTGLDLFHPAAEQREQIGCFKKSFLALYISDSDNKPASAASAGCLVAQTFASL